jgi:hypothetical protein
MEEAEGIELSLDLIAQTTAFEAGALPLGHASMEEIEGIEPPPDSVARATGFQPDTLPLSHISIGAT